MAGFYSMKKIAVTYWEMVKAALPIILIIWAAWLVTMLAMRVTATEIIVVDSGIAKILLGLIFTLLTPLIQHWFKNRKTNTKDDT